MIQMQLPERILRASDKKKNFLDSNGTLFLNKWYVNAWDFCCGYARIQRASDGKYNFVGLNKELLSKEWFSEADCFKNGLAKVQHASDGLMNLLKLDGSYLLETWYKDLDNPKAVCENGIGMVQRPSDDMWNFINGDGLLLSPETWFDDVIYCDDKPMGIVTLNGNYNCIQANGEYLLAEWVKKIFSFSDSSGVALVYIDDKRRNLLRTDGTFCFDRHFGAEETKVRTKDGKVYEITEYGAKLI